MRLTRLWVITLMMIVGMLFTGTSAMAQAQKVDVCHHRGNGTFIKINISANALDAHLRHGDALPGDPVPGSLDMIFGADCSLIEAETGPTLTVTEGQNATPTAGMRIKGQIGTDLWLGVENLQSAGNRVEADAGNPLPDGTYPLTFSFDGAGTFSLSLTRPTGSVDLMYDFASHPAPTCPVGSWTALIITIRDNVANAGLGLQNVMVNGASIGGFAPPSGTFEDTDRPGEQSWTVTGADFNQSFVVTADLAVSNLNAGDLLWAAIRVACP